MTAAMAIPGNTAATFLVHFFGTGLADDRYVVERHRARADGDIVPAPTEAPAARGARKTKRTKRTTATVLARDRTARVLLSMFARFSLAVRVFARSRSAKKV